MKMRLEKLTFNISKLMGGRNEKPRRKVLHLYLYFVYSKHRMKVKIIEYVICRQEAF